MSNHIVPVRQINDWWLRVWSRAGVLDGEIPPEGDTVQVAAASGVLLERSPDHPGRKEGA